MSLPALADLEELAGARILARLDLNVPVKDGRVEDDSRITGALDTVRWLLDRAPVVACCSHLGKAKGSPDPVYSLRPVAEALGAALGRSVTFVEDCLDPAASGAPAGSLLVLENLRFYPGEKANDGDFARRLAAPYSHYVNDAFGTAHRAHASVDAVPRLFDRGRRAAGYLMEREVAALQRLVDEPDQPFVAVVGGAKVSTKTEPLEALLGRVRRMVIGGGMANTFFLAKGFPIGRSLAEPDMVETAHAVMSRADELGIQLLLPTDVVVTDDLDRPTRVDVVAADAVRDDLMIVDLGPDSRAACERALGDARTVFWNGPMGVFEVDAFAAGTLAVAHAISTCPGFTVVGGGESVMAVKRAGLEASIDHVSTGGGASLEFLTGSTLPAIAALET